ncbi:MAG TPA: DUF2238 domain-containing protein [Phycisphaerales bacterium]|nr:DUF2238 domain-containing protein [Phycisphaerales bacterium]
MIRYLPLALFVGAYSIGLGWWTLAQGNKEFLFYGAMMVLEIALVAIVHARVKLSMTVLWLLAVWGLLHMAGGTVPIPREFMASLVPEEGTGNVLYNFRPWPWFPKYDQTVHAFGFFTCTLLAWECLRAFAGKGCKPTPGAALLCGLVGMGLGAVNEVIEFVAVLTIPNTNVGGYENTGWDLVSNLTGCVLGGLVILARGRSTSAQD